MIEYKVNMAKYNNTVDFRKRNEIHETYSYSLVYVYSIPDKIHSGRLKIGSATLESENPTQNDILTAAHERIKQQTKTADIPYVLEHAELSVANDGSYFSDYDVHEILIRSGYERKAENTRNSHSEWFELGLEVAKKAIQAAKEGRRALTTVEKSDIKSYKFPFRPNQLDAINKTIKAINQNRKHYLWNAKMRFGKTAAAMQVAKEKEMRKVLIVTHRPSVRIDWYDDFNKVFAGTDYQYSSKERGEKITKLIKGDKPFVYFASLQDLRLSKRVVEDEFSGSQAEGFDKNDEVFDTSWDMLIVDEAHEGTQSNLGDTTFNKIPTNFTLQLSGTPFNILYKHEEGDIYTWDYVMEQEEKLYWNERHSGVPNPYSELPALSMFTYDIDKFANNIGIFGENFHDAIDGAFKFHEFFRVYKDDEGNDTSEFVHKQMVNRFLDLLVDNTLNTKFPYSTEQYRNYNKHSLWLLPNRVKVIEAMEKLLKDHWVFGSGQFGIVNISGNNQNDDEDKDAKDRVIRAINNYNYTITLTGQRLTTGASIPEWTAVFMMSDTSSATTYLQTAFRCQTPAKINGKLKTQGYVFDFAPDRTLKLIAEAIELNHRSGKTNTPEQKDAMRRFLNFCPILAAKGGIMKPYDVGKMLVQLKKAIIDRVSRNGFDDPKLYNDQLLKLNELELVKFNELKKIVGKSNIKKINEIGVNDLGMTELLTQKAEEAERKKKQKEQLSEAEKEALRKLKEAREQRKNAISILRAVSIRMPMLVYGANVPVKENITLQKFINFVDNESWLEFMPTGLSKEKFRDFIKYYDEEVFRGVAYNIRAKAFDCDDLLPTERIEAIAEIFNTFKNPDKETVLTPWNVVNLQMSVSFGGHDFYSGFKDKTGKPEWKSYQLDTSVWSKEDSKILEINSKSGLYPLLAAYNIYSRQLIKHKKPEDKIHSKLWKKVLENNIFVLCKSPMAVTITRRTLAGYSGAKVNVVYIKDLVQKLQQKDRYNDYDFYNELRKKFNFKEKNMKFTAVVGNPPYQVKNHQQIYPYFYLASRLLGEYVSLIFPIGWQEPKNGNNLRLLNKKEIKQDPQIVFIDNRQNVFQGISGAEWTNIILWKRGHDNGLNGKQKIYTNGENARNILLKTKRNHDNKPEEIRKIARLVTRFHNFAPVQLITSSRKPYGLSTDLLTNPNKYNLPPIYSHPKNFDDIKLFGLSGKEYYINKDYPIPKKTKSFKKFKVFVPYAWGNMSEKTGLGGAYSDIILAKPFEIATETYQEQGPFNTIMEARKHAKFLMTKFARALLYYNKHSQHSTTAWGAVPIQNYSELWWDKTISEIDLELMKKYGVSKKIHDFVMANIQEKSEDNILGYHEKAM